MKGKILGKFSPCDEADRRVSCPSVPTGTKDRIRGVTGSVL